MNGNNGSDELAGYRFDTLAVHGGDPDVTIGRAHPTVPPIVQASSYWYDDADELDRVLGGEEPGYVYGRYANPTVAAFERAVAALDGAPGAVAFASGMAAIHAVVTASMHPGTPLFASQDCYGGTYTLLATVMADQGARVRFVDVFDVPALEARLAAERPSLLLVEVISNPLERVADLPALAEAAQRQGVTLAVDSTFTTPYLVQPIRLGAEYVIHSATKYLGGHGDVTGGVVAVKSTERLADLHTLCKLTGAVLGPNEAYLALRGVRTLALRLERQCANALAVARWLAADSRIERVFYPGLPDSPDNPTARRVFPEGRFGAVLAFAIRGAGRDEVMRFMERLRLVGPAPTMGDCFSLVLYPVIASHRGLTPEQRQALGIADNVVRFSAGIEDPADLVADLDRALAQ